jgi:hypothetical protein
MFETVDLYCERTSPDFWAEPVNALTNALFLVGAWFGWRRANIQGAGSLGVWLLLALMCAIGVGSFLFHTFATNWSRLLDVLPILLFQLVYVWLYCREIAKIHFTYALGIALGYFVATIIGRQFPQVLNGSLIYAPAMIVLLVLGIYHVATRRIERYIVLGATGVFVVSLTSRTVDNAVCHYFPLGSHFMWHVCNALVLYLLLRGLLANRLEQPRPNQWLNPTPEISPALKR